MRHSRMWAVVLLTAGLAGCKHDQDNDGFSSQFDCNDIDATAHPGGTEVCDGVDNDCNNLVDDEATDMAEFHPDDDGDGHGSPGDSVDACEAPDGAVESDDDCDDGDEDVNPEADELCNNVDDDCDEAVDEAPVDGLDAFEDHDGDTYGDPETAITLCELVRGWVDDGTDCDDSRADVHPGAVDDCDGVDTDCDGTADDATVHTDGDGDGYGDPTSTSTCAAGGVADNGDCDDADEAIHPDADELCDGIDNDCSGAVDDNAVDAVTYYADSDGDGYGDDASAQASCDVLTGFVTVGGDCRDDDAGRNPTAVEECDNVDEDCDGVVDDNCLEDIVPYLVTAAGIFGVNANGKVASYKVDGQSFAPEVDILLLSQDYLYGTNPDAWCAINLVYTGTTKLPLDTWSYTYDSESFDQAGFTLPAGDYSITTDCDNGKPFDESTILGTPQDLAAGEWGLAVGTFYSQVADILVSNNGTTDPYVGGGFYWDDIINWGVGANDGMSPFDVVTPFVVDGNMNVLDTNGAIWSSTTSTTDPGQIPPADVDPANLGAGVYQVEAYFGWIVP